MATILILGGGNMGSALARYWRQAKLGAIHIVEPDTAKRHALSEHGIICHATLANAPQNFEALILAIKPQEFSGSVEALKNHVAKNTAPLISIMAGISLAALHQISPTAIRVMPNLPALIGKSMSVACAPQLAGEARALVTQLFEAVGQLAWVEEEELLHAATAISGSGPGYVFAFMEALEIAALKQGFSTALARQLVSQTLLGSALLATQSQDAISNLRQKVTSPGGTTEAALQVFTERALNEIVSDATDAATNRSKELLG